MNGCAPDRSGLAREVLRYIALHPDARDTVEGIAELWLSGRWRTPASAVLKDVLSDLVTQGVVDVRVDSDGAKRYGSHQKQG